MNDDNPPGLEIDKLRAMIDETTNQNRELAGRMSTIENGVREALQILQQRADDLQQRIGLLEAAKTKRKSQPGRGA